MTVIQLYQLLDNWYPRTYSCEWDHDGIMCMPHSQRNVQKILISLDATHSAIDKAITEKYDVILTHHPMLFHPISGISEEDGVGNLLCRLIEQKISVFSFHTRMDAAPNGVNDALASTLGLTEVETVCDFIRIGDLPKPMPFFEFATVVKEKLNAPCCKGAAKNQDELIRRVAVCGGEGKDFLSDAVIAGADAYLTGNLSYHTLNSIVPSEIPLLIAGHYETEQMICEVLQERLQPILPDVQIDIFHCNDVFTI